MTTTNARIPHTASLATVALMEAIADCLPHARIDLVTIGNGEQVIVLNRRSMKQVFVWDEADWERLLPELDTRWEG
jgi:hypothetical protein